MIYQINGSPIGFHFPPLVAAWLGRTKAKGRKIGDKIVFSLASLRVFLTKEHVPHVADFLEQNKIKQIKVLATECTKEKN